MCSGVVPQHPPMIFTKFSCKYSRINCCISSGDWSYCPKALGKPALGCAEIFNEVLFPNRFKYGFNWSVPKAQLNPTLNKGICEIDIKKAEQLYDKLEKLHYNNQNPKNHGNQPDVDVEDDDDDEDEAEINENNNEDARGYIMVQAAKAIEGMNPGKYNIIMNKMGKNPVNYANKTNQEIMREYIENK